MVLSERCVNNGCTTAVNLAKIWMHSFGGIFYTANNKKKHLRNFQNAVKILFAIVNVLIVKKM